MIIKNETPISVIEEQKRQLAEKDEKIVQLEAELSASKAESLMTMEAVAEVYEELQILKNGGTP